MILLARIELACFVTKHKGNCLFIVLLYDFERPVFAKAKSRQCQELLDRREYKYDAFVIYSQADSQWVIHQLRPQLEENRPKLRLCIHQRDWLGGRDITDNIVESIEASRC